MAGTSYGTAGEANVYDFEDHSVVHSIHLLDKVA